MRTGTYARAAAALGAQVSVTQASLVPRGWRGLEDWSGKPGDKVDVLCTSLTEDPTGKELKFFSQQVDTLLPWVFVCDAPVAVPGRKSFGLPEFVRHRETSGWRVMQEDVLCTAFGDAQAMARTVIHGEWGAEHCGPPPPLAGTKKPSGTAP